MIFSNPAWYSDVDCRPTFAKCKTVARSHKQEARTCWDKRNAAAANLLNMVTTDSIMITGVWREYTPWIPPDGYATALRENHLDCVDSVWRRNALDRVLSNSASSSQLKALISPQWYLLARLCFSIRYIRKYEVLEVADVTSWLLAERCLFI